jgi:hypothetical protein
MTAYPSARGNCLNLRPHGVMATDRYFFARELSPPACCPALLCRVPDYVDHCCGDSINEAFEVPWSRNSPTVSVLPELTRLASRQTLLSSAVTEIKSRGRPNDATRRLMYEGSTRLGISNDDRRSACHSFRNEVRTISSEVDLGKLTRGRASRRQSDSGRKHAT